MQLGILGVTGLRNSIGVLGSMFANTNSMLMVVLGVIFGVLLTAGHFYALRKTVQWSFDSPGWGTALVLIPSIFRFAFLAVILFLVIKWGGFAITVGILIGVTFWLIIWVIRQNRNFNNQFMKDHSKNSP